MANKCLEVRYNFYLKKKLHDKYIELKKTDGSITITSIFRKGFSQTVKEIEEKMRLFEKPFDHKSDHSLKN